MARIAGVDLPKEKRVEIGLTYVYGIGRKSANDILAKAGVNPDTRVKDLTEDEIKDIFVRTANMVITEKDEICSTYEQIMAPLLSTSELEKEQANLETEINVTAELIEECIKENAHVALDQADYQKRYDALVARFEKAKDRLTEISDLIVDRLARRHQIEMYLQELRERELITEFHDADWLSMVDHITVYSKKDIRVKFKDGTEIRA